MKRAVISVLTLSLLTGGIAGCETKAGTGALVGGAAGAGIGAIVGHNSHGRTASGAAIGGAVGAIGGALIGNEMDKDDARKEAAARHAAQARALSREDVIAWVEHGDRDDVIIDRIERSGTIFRLSSRDENALRDQGVSEEVIRVMRDTGRR